MSHENEARDEGACREKTWEERSIEEKMEMLCERLNNLQEMVSTANEVARRHQHGDNGEVLVPADRGDRNAAVGRRRRL